MWDFVCVREHAWRYINIWALLKKKHKITVFPFEGTLTLQQCVDGMGMPLACVSVWSTCKLQSDWPRQGNTFHLINFMHIHICSLVMCCCVFTHASDTSTHWRYSHSISVMTHLREPGNIRNPETFCHYGALCYILSVSSCMIVPLPRTHILVQIYSENKLSISIAATVILAFPMAQGFSAYHL